MKKSTRICLIALVALMILSLPLVVPSGAVLNDSYAAFMDFAWDSEGLMTLLVPCARFQTIVHGKTQKPLALCPSISRRA